MARIGLGLAGTVALVLAFTSPAAAHFDLEEPASDEDGLSSTTVEDLWDDPKIPVCWEMTAKAYDVFAQERTWVRDAVARSWEQHSNVDFQGWGICEVGAQGVKIAQADVRPVVHYLGSKAADQLVPTMYLNFTFVEEDMQDCDSPTEPHRREMCIRVHAVHEFGHALGFTHEHMRADFEGPTPACENSDLTQGSIPGIQITEYDEESVMNYCDPRPLEEQNQLSTLDQVGVRLAYGPWSEEVPYEVMVTGTLTGTDDELVGDPVTGGTSFFYTRVLSAGSEPLEIRRRTCVGSEVVVETAVQLTRLPDDGGKPTASVLSHLWEGSSCDTDDLEAGAHDHVILGSNVVTVYQELHTQEAFSADEGTVLIEIRRHFDPIEAMQACGQTCVDQANSTVFFTPPPGPDVNAEAECASHACPEDPWPEHDPCDLAVNCDDVGDAVEVPRPPQPRSGRAGPTGRIT